MKRFLLLLAPVLALALADSPSVAQTVNLFDWSQGNVVAKQEFVTFDDTENRASIPTGVTVQTYREYKITSPDGKTDYTLRLRGTDKTFDANGCYDGFSITDNTGRELLLRLGRDPLCHVNYLDMDTSKKGLFHSSAS